MKEIHSLSTCGKIHATATTKKYSGPQVFCDGKRTSRKSVETFLRLLGRSSAQKYLGSTWIALLNIQLEETGINLFEKQARAKLNSVTQVQTLLKVLPPDTVGQTIVLLDELWKNAFVAGKKNKHFWKDIFRKHFVRNICAPHVRILLQTTPGIVPPCASMIIISASAEYDYALASKSVANVMLATVASL